MISVIAALLAAAPIRGPTTATVSVHPEPALQSPRFLFRGRIRHHDVEGEAYLELLATISGEEYFARTPFTGTSEWRPFVVPFDATSTGGRPTRIVLRLVLPGSGSVEVEGVELIDLVHGARGWLEPRESALFFGTAAAIFAACVVIMRALASRGARREGVFAIWGMLMFACIGAIAFGLASAAIRQPWYVTLPFFAAALTGIAVLLVLRGALVKRYPATPTPP